MKRARPAGRALGVVMALAALSACSKVHFVDKAPAAAFAERLFGAHISTGLVRAERGVSFGRP